MKLKYDKDTAVLNTVVQTAKLFAEPNRVRILALLWRDAPLCVCEICDTLQLSQPLVSRHLKQMRQVGAVQTEAAGKWMLYSLDKEHELYVCYETLLENIADSLPKRVQCQKREHKLEVKN